MKAKKFIAFTFLAILLLATFACGGGEDEEEGVKEVKWGFGLPLSGLHGVVLGIPARQGLELANEYIGEFTVAGQRYKWDLIFEDNRWSSEGGMASATKLIFEDGVDIMTQMGGEPTLAVQPICEGSGVILFTGGGGLEVYGPGKPHTFSGGSNHYGHAAALFKYVSEALPEVKTASLVFEDNVIGHEASQDLATAAEYYGIEWIDEEYYPVGTVEFYPVATRMVSKDPDLCYMDIRVIAAMRDMGWEGIPYFMLWGSTWGEGMWDDLQGYLIYLPVPLGEALTGFLAEFAAEYQERFDAELLQTAFFQVTQLYFMTDALKKAGTVDDVDRIIATLETETFDTPMGPVRFGLSEVGGFGRLQIGPCWIGEIRGEEYHVVLELSIDEAEALTLEIFGK